MKITTKMSSISSTNKTITWDEETTKFSTPTFKTVTPMKIKKLSIKLNKGQNDEMPSSFRIRQKQQPDLMDESDDVEKKYNGLHTLVQSSPLTLLSDDRCHPFWKNEAIEFFQDPSVDITDKKNMIESMSLHNLQFHLLKQCDKVCRRVSKKDKMKKMMRRSMSMRKVPMVIVVKNEGEDDGRATSLKSLSPTSSSVFGQRQAFKLLNLMVDFGGRGFVMKTEHRPRPKGQYCRRRCPEPSQGSLLHAICKTKYHDENEALFVAFANKLLDIGGKELVVLQNDFDHTALHEVIYNQPSPVPASSSSLVSESGMELISKRMIEIGGDELITRENHAMEMAFSSFIPVDIMSQ
jgi:hypothetical protein